MATAAPQILPEDADKKGANVEAIIATTLVSILLVLVIPLPNFMLDLLLATNIAISLSVLLTAFYAERPLDFAVFPGLLLVTTLFRLSLNVASTRLILSQGNAGALIQAFGDFVVAGNYVVGTIIFLVLVIINFIVITKGSGRIAEVAARFTLDALPGKQMAIDADLNAGLIDDDTARKRRDEVGREADFYGAMDGASKFVRGDAIAGLIITAINIIGGLIIGIAQLNMSAADAAQTFVLLSIGDGLVSQIPALLISTAAGIIVSRASGSGNLASEFKLQLFNRPFPLLITGGFLAVLGLIPGLPLIPFWLLAAVTLTMGQRKLKEEREAQAREAARIEAPAEEEEEEDKPSDLLLVDPLELEIGYALIPIVDPNQAGDLLERVRLLRQQLAMELGIVVPPIRIRDNVALGSNKYVIKLKGNPIAEGEVLPGYHLALVPEDPGQMPPGVEVTDPTFGLPAIWISERHLPEAERMGLSLVEAPAVVTTHLLEILRKSAYQLLDRQEVKKLIDKVQETAPALVEELVPDQLSVGSIQKVLKRLLRESVPIRDLVSILEALADNIQATKNIDVLTEYVRAALSPTITRQFADETNIVRALVLEPSVEQELLQRAKTGELHAGTLGLPAERAEALVESARLFAREMLAEGHTPILLASPVLRPTLFAFLAPMIQEIVVLSYHDLLSDVQVDIVGQVTFDEMDAVPV
ncbi:MAG: flagellar biosynthesis protein FlhA [Rhodothermales bacterium]|nr:flagellar biosynthesis protein FlhA [Rhodothermales bacterium]MBO6780439.1 flagellar biosynthesis protein FlhA [Rhodothermales bacterium]